MDTKRHFMDTKPDGIATEGSGHGQEGDLVDDGAPPHRPVVGQPGPLPHHAVHPGFFHYTAVTREIKTPVNTKKGRLARKAAMGSAGFHLTTL